VTCRPLSLRRHSGQTCSIASMCFPWKCRRFDSDASDIPLLVEYFVHRYAKRAGKKIDGIGEQSLDLLRDYPWPGNIRELQNVIERAVIVSDTNTLSIDERWLVRERVVERMLERRWMTN